MVNSKTSILDYFRKNPHLGVICPLYIYTGFIAAAVLIGREHSCDPIADLYYWGGLISLPLLFAIPFICTSKLHIALRLLTGLSSTALGVVIWAFAYEAAGMYFMCRLF